MACQTGERNATEDHRRESIDYVALNAQPRPRKNGSKKQVRKKITRVVGSATAVTGRRACTSGRSHVRNQETADGMVHSGLHHATAGPSDEESREDEDVSSFLDSFSASRMASQSPASASQGATTGAQLSPSSLPQRGETLDGRTREADDAVVDNAQATLALSEPLAQVNRKEGHRQRVNPAE